MRHRQTWHRIQTRQPSIVRVATVMDDDKLEVRIMRIYNTRIADNVDLGTNMLVLFLILILDLELWGSTMVGIVANKNSLI